VAYAVVAIVLGGVLGLAFGGRLHNLGEHRLAAWPLLPAGVVAQVLSNLASGTLSLLLLLGSYALLLAFAIANTAEPGPLRWSMLLVSLGLALNFTVIAVNRGMPVRPQAVFDAGIAKDFRDLESIKLQAKHHFERESDRLMVLADVIPVRPLREVLSAGDAVMSMGIAAVVATLLRKEPSSDAQAHPTRSLPSEG
jgi:hypothetical protein